MRNIKCQMANTGHRILDAMKSGGKLISCSTYHFHLWRLMTPDKAVRGQIKFNRKGLFQCILMNVRIGAWDLMWWILRIYSSTLECKTLSLLLNQFASFQRSCFISKHCCPRNLRTIRVLPNTVRKLCMTYNPWKHKLTRCRSTVYYIGKAVENPSNLSCRGYRHVSDKWVNLARPNAC